MLKKKSDFFQLVKREGLAARADDSKAFAREDIRPFDVYQCWSLILAARSLSTFGAVFNPTVLGSNPSQVGRNLLIKKVHS